MTKIEIEHRITQKIGDLPLECLREVLDFVEFLDVKYMNPSHAVVKEEQVHGSPRETLRLLPKHNLGKIYSSLRREELYTDAR
jgi:hypothetical protein